MHAPVLEVEGQLELGLVGEEAQKEVLQEGLCVYL